MGEAVKRGLDFITAEASEASTSTIALIGMWHYDVLNLY